LPAGYVQTAGSDPTTVDVAAGSNTDIGDDGYQPQGSVNGTVYLDEDGDGVYTPGTDTPLSGVDVVITDTNGTSYTVTTDGNGYFSQIVPPGDTQVDVDDADLPAGVSLTTGSTDPTTVNVPVGGTATDDTGYVQITTLPQLHLDKRVSPGNVASPGDTLTYTLAYSNSGTSMATGVVITDFIPANTTYLPGSVTVDTGIVEFYDGTDWSTDEPATVVGLRWLVGDLPADGVTREVSFQVQVNMTIVTGAGGSQTALQYTPDGWRVLEPDTSMLTPTPTLTITTASTAELAAPTATPVLTPTLMPVDPTATPVLTPTLMPVDPTATPVITITPTVEVTSPVSYRAPGWAAPVWQQITVTLTITPTPLFTPTEAPVTTTSTPAPVSIELPITPTSELTTTPTVIPTFALTPTEVSTITPSVQPPTGTAMPTETPAPTSVLTETLTPTPTLGAQLPGATITPTLETPVIEVTPTAVITITPVPTGSVTPTPAVTETLTITATVEPTVTATPAVTVSPTPTLSAETAGPIVPFEEYHLTITNTATIDSNETPTQTDSVDVPLVTVVDPRLTKQMDPTRAQVGDEITIVLIVRNHGNANATNVVVRDQLAPELDLLRVSATRGVVDAVYGAGGVFTVTIDVLGPGEDSIITARARVNESADPLPAIIRNEAALTFQEGSPRVSNITTVNVPIHDGGDDDDDDDDDDDRGPSPTPTPTPMPVTVITPTPAVFYLPETGVGQSPAGTGLPVGIVLLAGLLALAALLTLFAALSAAARRD
jgi:uncharacterized repeat protein (TIGR01451 family)